MFPSIKFDKLELFRVIEGIANILKILYNFELFTCPFRLEFKEEAKRNFSKSKTM